MELTAKKSKSLRRWIVALSIAIPVAVAVLFGAPPIEGVDTSFLPPIYAGINALTAVLLVVALVLVKKRRLRLHENVIKICMALSVLFLLCYVAYHMTSPATMYGDVSGDHMLQESELAAVSSSRLVYFILLITHILLSVVVIPLVLYSFLFATEGRFEKHRKWTKFTWPIWFYVAASGVIVYYMISPYYR